MPTKPPPPPVPPLPRFTPPRRPLVTRLHRAFVWVVQQVNPAVYVVLDNSNMPTVFLVRTQAVTYLDHLLKIRRQYGARLVTRHLW